MQILVSSVSRKLLIRGIGTLILCLTCLSVLSCEIKERKRPYGLANLGKISDLQRPESFLSEQGLLLRFDDKGFSAMSLLCSYDLAPLQVKQVGDKQILVSQHSASSYSLDGSILSGPTTHSLPYYELVAASGVYNGPIDTLFAKIGSPKSNDWKLKVP